MGMVSWLWVMVRRMAPSIGRSRTRGALRGEMLGTSASSEEQVAVVSVASCKLPLTLLSVVAPLPSLFRRLTIFSFFFVSQERKSVITEGTIGLHVALDRTSQL